VSINEDSFAISSALIAQVWNKYLSCYNVFCSFTKFLILVVYLWEHSEEDWRCIKSSPVQSLDFLNYSNERGCQTLPWNNKIYYEFSRD